ncbi:hypothetical protein OEZ85_000385 [Tetradesmus obliquus]|uniref:Amino acid transporter transmembrane domain-containing protein n=2 Tax=Tetradesmus obliquus TaxID=3088 RepID=A0ABY8UTL3_TETOB|nr:hypothetical protein OEZ85_000385 [Tetradesmus obliquus]
MANSTDAKSVDAKSVDADVFVDQQIAHDNIKRTAGWTDVAYHSVTAMVGAGVLGLPSVFAHLGWAGGCIMLAFSFWVSWYTYKLLAYMHEVPDLDSKEGGGIKRLDRYDQLSCYILGKNKGKWVLLPFQIAVLLGMAITYTVVGGNSLHAFTTAVNPEIKLRKWVFYIIFGGLELLLSLIPGFTELSIVSLLGALMSVAYCTIAVAMSGTVQPPAGSVNYEPMAVPRGGLERAMGIFNALTTILFAYSGHNVALEIQATLPRTEAHPTTVKPMMKGINITFIITGIAYFAVAIAGFYAFGTGVADNVLMSFAKGPTSWVVAMADMFVVVHVASAYQVYSQPVFLLIEATIKERTTGEHLAVQSVGIRIAHVVFVTLVAIMIPFFGSLMGLVGAIAITPTTFLLPPLLWLLYKKPARWSVDWCTNWFLVVVTAIIGTLGTIGAIYGIAEASKSYHMFA